ncbi:hypothetical protein [Nocardioides luteus]|uniref:hypothetical protein n=1 Tax=Nocardioides luteus TaxID=1844 RepID=UPI0018C935C6|nr:hypothetical protein [Nocardioides luteus]MBG6095181.1 hypothetical protein [Nocardioides luteus]
MSDLDGARDPAGAWWRGWTPWISALVLSALFAGATSGITYVRRSYEPPVDYPAMNESELEESAVRSAPVEPTRKKERLESSPSTRPTGAPTPAKAPRKLRPSASASTEPMASEEPSESPAGPFAGLGELLGLGGED